MTAIVPLLRFHDGEATFARWQARWPATVTFASASWIYVPFEAGGLTAGGAQDDAQMSISAPATATVAQTIERALDRGWLATLELWAGDAVLNATAPDAGLVQFVSYSGQVTGGQDTLTRCSISLGSVLNPIGRSVPPRRFDLAIMGTGAVFK